MTTSGRAAGRKKRRARATGWGVCMDRSGLDGRKLRDGGRGMGFSRDEAVKTEEG